MKYLILLLLTLTNALAQKPVETLTTPEQAAFRGYIGADDPASIADALNWQPNVMSKLYGGGGSQQLRLITIGDSLSTGIVMPPSMANSGGVIGTQFASGATGVTTVSNWGNFWIAPISQVAISGTYPFTTGSPGGAVVDFPADRLLLIYVRESGAGSFDLQWSNNAGSSWTTAQSINANGATAAVAVEISLSTSNFPFYRARLTNVTGGAVKVIAMGLYKSSGLGAIELRGMANLSGLDVINFSQVPDSIFTPAWTALRPDIAIVHFADAPEDWDNTYMTLGGASTTNGSTTINFASYPSRSYSAGRPFQPFPRVGDAISGAGIPAGARVTAHSEGSTSATISQAATATASGLTLTIQGAWANFYSRCKAAHSATDFVQVSTNPLFDSNALGGTYPAWTSGASYALNDRVVSLATSGANVGVNADPNAVWRCISAHTAGASTRPNTGASFATVWEEEPLNSLGIAAGDSRAALQASKQKAWALRAGESFINGFGMFRGYAEGVGKGLLAGDKIHPSTLGHQFKNQRVWASIPVSNIFAGGSGNIPGTTSEAYSLLDSANADSAGIIFPRSVNIRQASTGALTLWDRTTPTSQATAAQIFQNGGMHVSVNSSTAAVFGISSFLGVHPGSNGLMLGGRGSFWFDGGFEGIRLGFREVSANYTITRSDFTIVVTANSPTITLPDSIALNATVSNFTNAGAGAMGKVFVVKNRGAGTVQMATTNSELIDGSSPGTLATGASIKVQSTGTGWETIP